METDAPEVKVTLDRAQCWLVYAANAGDVEKTAFALNVRPIDVIDAAEACGWNKKLRAILELRKSARSGDLERAINRSLSFVQATRLRSFVDRVLLRLSIMDDEELEEYMFTGSENKMGHKPKQLSTRALADLASCMEKCSAIAAQALCDTSADRAQREEDTAGGESSGAIHAAIARCMAEIAQDASPAALLLDAQRSQVKSLVLELPPSPNDDEDH